ncbi:MAG: endopeptidase La [Candidatus Krumholzibacteriota bacterium]|nr:endopeptidase La [Candidatus Krumholzibacteriota bacterium]
MVAIKDNHELLKRIKNELAVIPINDGVVFPYMLVPLVLTDPSLIRLVEEVLEGERIVGVFTQIDQQVATPGTEDLYPVGCAMLIQKMARFPDNQIRIIGQGLSRIGINYFLSTEPYLRASIEIMEEPERQDDRVKALLQNVASLFVKLVDKSESYPEDLKNVVSDIKNPGRLADLLASNIDMNIPERQSALELLDPVERLTYVYEFLNNELEIARIGEKIRRDVHQEMDKEQKEYYLRQQIKAIQRELGDGDSEVELDDLKEKIDEITMPDYVRKTALKEWNRLARMSSGSAEYTVTRTYIDWILDLPWEYSTGDILEMDKAKNVLNREHYDLEQVKERILEFLSVKKLRKDTKGSILCFTGPPGTGKTSLGKSIASALGRQFVRISLGGIKDEAEIRGHRRTYIGALPGRIIQGIRSAGTNNPVFMLDEIDKLGNSFQGDPSAALLEVLDPEQNHSFEDHYLNLPFDLSRVMFITTANIRESIPPPLLDRMEVLEIPGYITDEKIQIARRFLVPRQLRENGISEKKLEITEDAIQAIIDRYTREAGVRNLERKIATIARKVAKKLVEGKKGPFRVSSRNLKSYLGTKDFPDQEMLSRPEIGVSTGMAKTSSGGVILFVEALAMKGRGTVKLTGHLGEVMKESAEAAVSFVRSHYFDQLWEKNFFENNDIHLHIPAGAVPKDGPSAGIAIIASLASLAMHREVRNDLAMTGEITLTGKVLPVGAVKEKVIAAHRAGIREVILPAPNRKDLEDIPPVITKEMRFRFIENVEEGISLALIQEVKRERPKAESKSP